MNNRTYLYTGGRPNHREGEGITHVIVEDGVEFIDDGAFKYWLELVSVHIPPSVKSIGEYSFHGCFSLSSINFPDSLQQIGLSAFARCTSLLSLIAFPLSLNEIGPCAFGDCESLVKVSIPPSITRIARQTFCNCSSLFEVIIPSSVINIDDLAFENCESLKSIKLSNGVQTFGTKAFRACASLQSIQIPSSTIHIDLDAFSTCPLLGVIYMPSASLHTSSSGLFHFCDPNLIILTDVDEFEYEYEYDGLQSMTLNNIHQCIQDLPNNPIPPNQQLQSLHHVLHQRFPHIARRAQLFGFTLLHLMVYYPNDIYEPLSTLLTKCPEAITAVDNDGKTPIRHVMTSTKHNMHPNCYSLLIRHCPDTVVHQAIQTGGLCGDDLRELVEAKSNALTLVDAESGLLPFMLAATPSYINVVDLSAVYELLSMNPSVLKDYL